MGVKRAVCNVIGLKATATEEMSRDWCVQLHSMEAKDMRVLDGVDLHAAALAVGGAHPFRVLIRAAR